MKACTFPERTGDFLDLAQVFWTRVRAAPRSPTPQLERDTVGMLGCLLAARVDGKSPAEYLTTEELRQRVRRWRMPSCWRTTAHPPDVRDLLAPALR